MKYKERIYEAWQFTQNNKKMIVWYGFLPALLTTLVGILYMLYQIMAFKASPLFDDAPQSFLYQLTVTILDFIQNNISLTVPLIIVTAVLLIIYLLFPILIDASMIQVISRRKNGQKTTLPEGIKFGMLRFLPLFEYSLLIRTFSFITITAEAAFILRNLGPGAFQTMLPIMIIISIVALLLHILFTFTEYYIVIDEESVISGIVKSCTLVILNIQQTIMLVILMLIIAVRILLQVVLVIIIPALLITGFAYFASTQLPSYAIAIIAAASVIFLFFASYLAAVVHVFSTTVWTFTFLDFTSREVPKARERMTE